MGIWSAGGQLNTSRWSLRACGLQIAALTCGGRNGGIHLTTEVYDGTTWIAGGDLLHKRQIHGCCGTSSAALAWGGSDGVAYLKSTEEYNGTIWSPGGDLPVTVANQGGCGTQSAGLSFGGSQGDVTHEYDGTVWSVGGPLIKARYKLAGCGTQSAGLSIGGYASGLYLVDTEEYNGTIWTPGGDLILARGDLAACGLQTAGLSFGGYVKYHTVKDTEEYDGAAWAAGGDMLVAVRWHAGCGTLAAGLSVITTNTEEYTGTPPPIQAKSIVRSKTTLTDVWIRSLTDLDEPALTDRIPSFWFLHSLTPVVGDLDNPTLYKVPYMGTIASLSLGFGAAIQKYHSFPFDEDADWYAPWEDVFQHEKCWAYDQHNNHLAILAKVQKAVHVYNLNSDVEDIIYSLQADEFESAVGLTFSDGRIDVFIPTVHGSGSIPQYYFFFEPARRESGAYLSDLYSFTIDGTGIDGPVLYSKAAVESRTYFGEFIVVLPGVISEATLEDPVFIPVRSKLTLVEDQYTKSETFLDDEYFIASECFLVIEDSDECQSKSHLNALNPDYHSRSKTLLASPYEFGMQSRVTAIGDYLLVGLMSNIYIGSLEDSDAALYLVLFDRTTFKCIWSKSLKVSRVTGTALYDSWLWEDIKTKDGFTHIFTEGKFEIELFDCFGTARIALARYGKLDAPYTTGAVWEEYDINLENPCNINLVKEATSTLLYPTGFIFKRRNPYDFPIKTGEPKKDYLCYTMRSESDLSADGIVELFQRDQADDYYVFAGSTPNYNHFAWLVALCEETSCRFIKSGTNLNIDFSSIFSKALLRVANPIIDMSGVIGQVNLEESLIKILQSKTAFEDSGLVQSKTFMDDYLIRSSVSLISNKNLAFPARYIVGTPDLSYKDECYGAAYCVAIISIVRIEDDKKAYHGRTCFFQGITGMASPALRCRPAIAEDYTYYIVRQMLHNMYGPPWDLPHYFLWKTHLTTYRGTQELPAKLYHEGTGVWPDYDIWSVDYLVELDHTPLEGEHEAQPITYLHDRLFYIYNDSGVYGIAYIWIDPLVQGYYTLSNILPEFTKIVSIDTDGTYLYALGYKNDTEGLWLVKLTIGLIKLDELVIFKGRLHTGDSYNAQFTFWDNVNNQFVIGIAPIAGRRDTDLGYGAIVYSPVDGSIKWWRNFYPSGIAVHTIDGSDTIYFQRKRDDTIGMYTTHGDYMGADLDISDLGGGRRFDMRGAQVREVGIETSVQSKTCLVRSAEEQDNLFPNIPGPTQVPREQRFLV